MEEILNVEYLDNLLREKNKHTVGNAVDVLPFLTNKRSKVKGNLQGVVGEYIRGICEVDFKKEKKKDQSLEEILNDEHYIVQQILNKVDFEDENSSDDFKRFLHTFLFKDNDEINPIHPYLLNYIPTEKENKNEIEKFGQFLKDVFASDNQVLKNLFNQKDHDDILTELILNNIEPLQENKGEKSSPQYELMLPDLRNLYQEDMIFLSDHKEYFLQSFELLTHFYMTSYICQMIMKFEGYEKANYEKPSPLYFALEWESMSKRRKPADELEGFKFIKGKADNLFVHINSLSYLSHNQLNEPYSSGELPVINYKELYEKVKQEGKEDTLLKDLKNWIKNYCEWKNINLEKMPETVSEAYSTMNYCLRRGMSTTVYKRYGDNFMDLIKNRFIKPRGSLGNILNINHEMLLLLTAISVKDNRIPLNQLFEEFSKRGVMFDRYSKKEIIALFDSLNILDKKSDSGDAQYVKPIL